ncbi:hypothetical protein DM02DRAFT_734160 [Periconia macrospinosa]|uniref:AA1-like domain-containing protein n=1 Tax=Periconia macrospinosa TaxID=97972 RepID=A0A2V1D1X5_9PLEO|nr:hypothetical protein DM02DRAFT_734160 [Periconia macrospinosa]
MYFFTAAFLTLPLVCFGQRWLPFDRPLPCMTKPISLINAGDTLEFHLSNSRNTTCEMTIDHSNPAFLPYSMTVKPRSCAGDQIANFSVPRGSPNGIASVSWQCIGSQALSCSLLNITGGSRDYEQLQKELAAVEPQVTCLRNASSLYHSVPVMSNATGDSTLDQDCI